MKKKTESLPEPQPAAVKRVAAPPDRGLTATEVQARIAAGCVNVSVEPPSKTVGQIIRGNVLTYFNLVFFVLAVCVALVGSFRDLTFMPVIIINMGIGIFQELRSKRTLDKLSLLSAPKAAVIRDGQQVEVNVDELVLDDIVVLSAGDQICADATVAEGRIFVNEALITGEADEISKEPGSELLSGSFVVSGQCRARLEKVGRDSFVSRLTIEAKKSKKRQQSEMMKSLTRLVQWIGVLIIPLGAALFYSQFKVQELGLQTSVVKTVGALVGMIPEGLYLLTSIALTVGVIRLAQKRVLVHDLGCIETLARVDVLCVDKTGTITESRMQVDGVALLCEERFNESDIVMVMCDYLGNMSGDNDTMKALRDYFKKPASQSAVKTLPFSSALKYGGVSFAEDESYLLGAPEIILGERYEQYRADIEPYSAKGYRVLLLALYDGDIEEKPLKDGAVMPLALMLLANKIRPEAPATFKFFAEQGVAVKVISGDNALTVSEVARRAGIPGAESYVDATELDSDEKIVAAAGKYTVFGRVKPEQKRKLVRALKAQGHKVAMTGDGVNDVLALKEADCSIAMASGSDVAAHVSHLVLLESDFAAMPFVVMEGRRVINNIERAAALFLVKNIFSFSMAILTLIFALPYPVSSAQLSLVSTLTIGAPSFVLALEPNYSIVKGHFISNVLYRAFPAGLTDLFMVLTATLFAVCFALPDEQLSTVSALILAAVGLFELYKVCIPFTTIRKLLLVVIIGAVAFCATAMRDLFALSPLTGGSALVLATLIMLAPSFIWALSKGLDIAASKLRKLRERAQEKKRHWQEIEG